MILVNIHKIVFWQNRNKNLSGDRLCYSYKSHRVFTTVELQRLQQLWDRRNLFEIWVVRATEG